MDVDLEPERDRRRRSYRACWIGFALYGVGLAAAAVVAISTLLLLFTGQIADLGYWLGIDSFDFRFESVRTWERLLACLALAAAWPTDAGWRRRAGLLLLMAIGDVVLWAVVHGDALGVADKPTAHLVFCHHLRTALGWSRFLLIANLSADLARHAGMPRADEFGKAARSTAVTGAALWFVYFLGRIDWRRPWPLAERRLTLDALHLLMASEMISALCLIQASLLTLLAGRAAARALREMADEDRAFDPWSKPSVAFEDVMKVPSFAADRCEHPPGSPGDGSSPGEPAAR